MIQLDLNVSKQKSPWLTVCSDCQHERVVSYSQAWNIGAEKCGSVCRSCAPKNTSGLVHGKGNAYKGPKTSGPKLSYVQFWSGGFVTEAGKQKQRTAKLGLTGVLANHYVDGRTSENRILRTSDAYKSLRKYVMQRDEFTCQDCKTVGGKLEMHHIKEWCNYPELRFEASNCVTLCKPCHAKTDNYTGKVKVLK